MQHNIGDTVQVEDSNGNDVTGEVIDTESHRRKEMVEVEVDGSSGWFFVEDVGEA